MVIDGKKLNKGKIINKTDISLFKRHDIKEITCAILNKKELLFLNENWDHSLNAFLELVIEKLRSLIEELGHWPYFLPTEGLYKSI